MALQTFTAGQILTAAQVTALQANDYNQTVSAKTGSYVLTAADKGTRITMSSASATTITVNTSLFTAGDSLRIQNLNGGGVCTVTAGTATVTSAGPLAIPSWGGGQLYFTSASAAVWFPDATNNGLTLINTTTIGTTVASVTVSNAFSATYDNYRIMVSGGSGTASVESLLFTLGSTSTGYYYASNGRTFANADNSNGGANQPYWLTGGSSNTTLSMCTDVFQPFLTDETSFASTRIFATTTGTFFSGGGYLNNTTSYTAFTLTVGSGTLTGGTIRVYGYANS